MPRQYRVRFTQSRQLTLPSESPAASRSDDRSGSRSCYGCQQCKLRKIKCDEAYPVCLRCKRRGSTCCPAPRVPQWQMVIPSSLLLNVSTRLSDTDQRLLRHWFERTSQIMVIDPQRNPLSYPLLQHLSHSASLVHAIQSLSTAHEHGFSTESMASSLQQRQLALVTARTELQATERPTIASFLTALLLGVSSCWVNQDMTDYGKDHLRGARAILDTLLEADNVLSDTGDADAISLDFVFGCYVYWDMCCALVANVDDLPPIDSIDLVNMVRSPRTQYHAVAGFFLDLFLLLARVARYCRAFLDGAAPSLTVEAELECQLLLWTPLQQDPNLSSLGECFRRHGLIVLYRHCGLLRPVGEDGGISAELATRQHALAIIHELRKIPDSSPYLNLQSLPLLTAGAELEQSDIEAREEVCCRFQALQSMNRSPTNVWAQDLLRGLWDMRDRDGPRMSWLEYMLHMGWRFSMA